MENALRLSIRVTINSWSLGCVSVSLWITDHWISTVTIIKSIYGFYLFLNSLLLLVSKSKIIIKMPIFLISVNSIGGKCNSLCKITSLSPKRVLKLITKKSLFVKLFSLINNKTFEFLL